MHLKKAGILCIKEMICIAAFGAAFGAFIIGTDVEI